MKNTKCLVITHGFFGDIMFAGSLAEKLRNSYDIVDYHIGFPQMRRLTQNNPFISNVYVSEVPSPVPVGFIDRYYYDRVIELQPLNYIETPCEEYQRFAGVENPTPEYKVYTEPLYDEAARKYIEDIKKVHKKPVVAVMSNWQSKTYRFTKEQYILGVDVPNLGYGGSHRDVPRIIYEISKHFFLLDVGMGQVPQQKTSLLSDEDRKSLLFEASLMKYCDAFIGTEGGLCNLAAGVGCRTIITGDFVHQLYGWNGVLKKINDPKLGPVHYFKDAGHVELDPYLSDEEVSEKIISLI